MKLRVPATGAPRRTPAGASGSESGSSARSLASDAGAQRCAGKIRNVRGEIADLTRSIDEARLLAAEVRQNAQAS